MAFYGTIENSTSFNLWTPRKSLQVHYLQTLKDTLWIIYFTLHVSIVPIYFNISSAIASKTSSTNATFKMSLVYW